jgi:hypothetical protein
VANVVSIAEMAVEGVLGIAIAVLGAEGNGDAPNMPQHKVFLTYNDKRPQSNRALTTKSREGRYCPRGGLLRGIRFMAEAGMWFMAEDPGFLIDNSPKNSVYAVSRDIVLDKRIWMAHTVLKLCIAGYVDSHRNLI